VKIKEYRGLLAVFIAGAIGISLLCSVSGMAIQDLNESTAGVDLQPADIVEAAVSNLNTAGALTMQAFAELIPTSTPTLRPTHTVTSFPTTVAPLPTAFRFPTSGEPTRTRRPRPTLIPTITAVPPTRTPIPPTNTPVPTATDVPTITPVDTATPIPPTDTIEPPPTSTTEPPVETDTPSGPPILGATPTP
jgi:hypothetical protein